MICIGKTKCTSEKGLLQTKEKEKTKRTKESAQFVMIMSVFFTSEACLFQVVTICIQWRPASCETSTG